MPHQTGPYTPRSPASRPHKFSIAAGFMVWASLAIPGQAQAQATSPQASSAQSSPAQIIGAGYSIPRPIDAAPGQVITLFVRIPGKTPADPVSANPPLPVTLGGFSILLRQTFADPQPVPILSVADSQSCSNLSPAQCDTVSMITVQIPFELMPNLTTIIPRVTGPANFARLEIHYNDSEASALFLNPLPDRIHVLNSCDVAASLQGVNVCLPLISHADGSLVSGDKPAQTGEVLSIALVGLGQPVTAVASGAPTPDPAPDVDRVLIGLNTGVNQSPQVPAPASSSAPNAARLRAGAVGIYDVQFTVPSLPFNSPGCNSSIRSNLTVSIARITSFDGLGICVSPAAQ